MPLILAIEPDPRQASKLAALARGPLGADLLVGDSTDGAFEKLAGRLPDLVLTSLLLSPKDEAALTDRLRDLDSAGRHVQTLVIPVLGAALRRSKAVGGVLTRLRRSRQPKAVAEGCDPAVFAAQITEYLERAAAERAAAAQATDDEIAPNLSNPSNPSNPSESELAIDTAVDSPAAAAQLSLAAAVNAAVDNEPPSKPPLEPLNLADVSSLSNPSNPSNPSNLSNPEDWSEIALDEAGQDQGDPGYVITAEPIDIAVFVHELDEPSSPGVEASDSSLAPVEDLWMPLANSAYHGFAPLGGGCAEPAVAPDVSADVSSPSSAGDEQSIEAPPAPKGTPGTAARRRSGGTGKARRGGKAPADEQAFFDPEQCGFGALIARLDELAKGEDPSAQKRP